MPKKYTHQNGILTLDPAWIEENSRHDNSITQNQALLNISSCEDLMEIQETLGPDLFLPAASVQSSLEIIQGSSYIEALHLTENEGSEILDNLIGGTFKTYGIPLGLLNKLLVLRDHAILFRIDDSSNMNETTKTLRKNALSQQLRTRFEQDGTSEDPMSRWYEIEDLLHVYIDILAYIPTPPIFIKFLNRSAVIKLDHAKIPPELFKKDAHQKVISHFYKPRDAFYNEKMPAGSTPLYTSFVTDIQTTEQSNKTLLVYIGHGNDSEGYQHTDLINLLKDRLDPHNHPIHLIMHSHQKIEWMNIARQEAPFVYTAHTFESEHIHITQTQGPVMPYNKGWYIMAALVGAMKEGEHDLDKLDENLPFTKFTLDNLLGYKISDEQYQRYWDSHGHAKNLVPGLFERFKTEKSVAADIVPETELERRQRRAGYDDKGERPQSVASAPSMTNSVFSCFSQGGNPPATQTYPSSHGYSSGNGKMGCY